MNDKKTFISIEEYDKDQRSRGSKIVSIATRHGLLIAFILVVIVFSSLSPYFFTTANFLNIALALSITLMLASGETVALVTGLPDMSVASTLAFSGVVTALLMANNVHFLLAIIIAIITGAGIGFINGIVTSKLKVNALITTLGTLATFRGLSFIISGGKSISISNPTFENLGRGRLLGIPIPFIIVISMCVIIYLVMNFTVFGRRIKSVGGNSNISQLFGINVDRIKITAFVISGVTAAIGGVIMAAKIKAGSPIAGTGMELAVITAAILGGTSLSGGVGNIWGTVLGVAFLSFLGNGFTLTYVSSYMQETVRGIVLIGAVALDVFRSEKKS